jgi:hypothetical protein
MLAIGTTTLLPALDCEHQEIGYSQMSVPDTTAYLSVDSG